MKAELAQYPGIPRWKRRIALKEVQKGRRHTTMEEANRAGLQELMAKYPIRTADARRILRVLHGTSGREELLGVVKDGLRDVPLFCRWAMDNWTKGEPFIRSLRDGGTNLHASVLRLYDATRELHAQARADGTSDRSSAMIIEGFNRARDDFMCRGFRSLSKRLLGVDIAEGVLRISPQDTPSLFTFFDYLSRIMFQSAPERNARNPHNKRASDFSDGLHAIFLPLVDVFRADKQSQAILKQMGEPQRTKLAPSLKDLPSFIELMAENR